MSFMENALSSFLASSKSGSSLPCSIFWRRDSFTESVLLSSC